MGVALRKNITLTDEENQVILDFCKKMGRSFSEVVRTATLNYIAETEQEDLATFLAKNCEYVDDEEQKDFNKIIDELKADEDEGREINLNEIL